MDMKSVWAVSRGSYSDYRVLCVCDSKERAEQVAALPDSDPIDDMFVEQILLLDHEPEKVTIYSMQEEILDDGTTAHFFENIRTSWEFDLPYGDYNKPVYWDWSRPPYIQDRGGRLTVGGTDLERVRKVFGDRKAMLRSDPAMRRTMRAG